MSFVMEFDPKNNILRGILEGRVTDAILLDSYAAAARYATSHPPCRGLLDCSKVTEFEVSTDTIREVAEKPPIIPTGYMRVIVASQDYLFGMMRMFQILSEASRPDLHVVRTIDEAERLLLVDLPEFKPVS
jgi:hypothetical protein